MSVLDPAAVLALHTLAATATATASRRALAVLERELLASADHAAMLRTQLAQLDATNQRLQLERDLAVELAGCPTFEHRKSRRRPA